MPLDIQQQEYEKLVSYNESSEDYSGCSAPNCEAKKRRESSVNGSLVRGVIVFISGLILGALGLWSRQWVIDERIEKPLIPREYTQALSKWNFVMLLVGTAERNFVYNHTFSEAPSQKTDAAWESIFPPHGGFFHHTEIAPDGASLAVYHQLHCLVSSTSLEKTFIDDLRTA